MSMKIYTRTGDEGETGLFGGGRVPKDHPRVAAYGDVRLTTQVVGFKKVKFYTQENIGSGQLSMPEQEMHTTAFWLHFPAPFLACLPDLSRTSIQNGIVGAAKALRTVAALLMMCDPRDLGIAVTGDIARVPGGFEPDVFLYDNYPGGVGHSAALCPGAHCRAALH